MNKINQKILAKKYFKIGNKYVAKKLVFAGLIALLLCPVIVKLLLLPWADNHLGRVKLYADSKALPTFSGNAAVHNLQGDILYQGEIKAGLFDGQGVLYDAEQNKLYEGEFVQSKFHGQGSFYQAGKLYYTGEFAENQFHGQGRKYENGELAYEGEFKNGVPWGYGSFFQNQKLKYNGEFIAGRRNGTGASYYDSGALEYEGTFLDDTFNGAGMLYDPEGRLHYEGAFTFNRKNGLGKLYGINGALLYEGLFKAGEIDYLALLGAKASAAEAHFKSRSFISENPNYQFSVYEHIDAAVIYEKNDTLQPDYVAAVMIYGSQELDGFTVGMTYSALTAKPGNLAAVYEPLPDSLNAGTLNAKTAEILKHPGLYYRRIYQSPLPYAQISAWSTDKENAVLFYTLEYLKQNAAKK